MFDQLVVSSAARKPTNTSWTVAVSVVIQGAVVIFLLLIPFLYPQVLSPTFMSTKLVAPPAGAPPPPPAAAPAKVVRSAPRVIPQTQLQAPTSVPKAVEILKEAPAPPPEPAAGGAGVIGGVAGGTGELLGGFGSGAPAPVPPPPPPPPVAPPPPPKPSGPIKIGGQVQSAKLVNQPQPSYPVMAKQARISGQVVLHAIISKDGSVTQLEVVSGNQILAEAAVAAVKQWRYRPTLLNGDPVEVDTTISVLFSLGS